MQKDVSPLPWKDSTMKLRNVTALLSFVFFLLGVVSAGGRPTLTIPLIMQGERFIGSLPDGQRWSEDSKSIYFRWNPEFADDDSLYVVSIKGGKPQKVPLEKQLSLPASRGAYNKKKTAKVYSKNGDIFLLNIKSGSITQITRTLAFESAPSFSSDESQIIFKRADNLFAWSIKDGTIVQLTDFRSGSKKDEDQEPKNTNDKWLKKEERRLITVLDERLSKAERSKENRKALEPQKPLKVYLSGKRVFGQQLSPDGRYVTFLLSKRQQGATRTIVPEYITETGYTATPHSRTNVGAPQPTSEFGIYDRERDTVYYLSADSLPGIYDTPAYLAEYADTSDSSAGDTVTSKAEAEPQPRRVTYQGPYWSPDGAHAIVIILAQDRKDRWITKLDPQTAQLTTLDRQHDDAWIGGPGVGWGVFWAGNVGWTPDSKRFWFKSEKTGYSHLYTVNIATGKIEALTSGAFEVDRVALSHDGKYFYFIANMNHPGNWQMYRLKSSGGKPERMTSKPGRYTFIFSPDEKHILLRYSYTNQPWELFVMNNKPGAPMKQLTHSTTPEFNTYPWRDPEVVTFTARDSANIYARLYRPDSAPQNGAAVIFVHGAGYLQNAHKWWSSYYHEYMFHNFLADNGYTVLDIDYRGSRGYGRDWRTAIYRNMGGKDLTDQVDGAKFLVANYNIDSARIGIYGGCYGVFITLMAMFKTPGVFAAGASLRSVTDWAHYNHGYTQAILNVPQLDSLAYLRSSPIYYAEGLQGVLLMCHGMMDDNVHFQDIVRLTQRLIELGKDNWELAVYPLERHGFREASSWTDEYKRIYKLFEENLKQPQQ